MNRLILALCILCACNDEPATVQVDNASDVVVYKVWWSPTQFTDAVAPNTSSPTLRTATGEDYAYALLAPGWDLHSDTPPTVIVVVRSKSKLSVGQGDTLHVSVSTNTFDGDCTHGAPLPQEEADLIVQRIFPGDFAGFRYAAGTCTLTPDLVDGGSD
jgi:hypothetical protein